MGYGNILHMPLYHSYISMLGKSIFWQENSMHVSNIYVICLYTIPAHLTIGILSYF
jgi:hypothetical protein